MSTAGITSLGARAGSVLDLTIGHDGPYHSYNGRTRTALTGGRTWSTSGGIGVRSFASSSIHQAEGEKREAHEARIDRFDVLFCCSSRTNLECRKATRRSSNGRGRISAKLSGHKRPSDGRRGRRTVRKGTSVSRLGFEDLYCSDFSVRRSDCDDAGVDEFKLRQRDLGHGRPDGNRDSSLASRDVSGPGAGARLRRRRKLQLRHGHGAISYRSPCDTPGQGRVSTNCKPACSLVANRPNCLLVRRHDAASALAQERAVTGFALTSAVIAPISDGSVTFRLTHRPPSTASSSAE